MKRQITDPEELVFLTDYRLKVQSGFYPVQMICADACVFWRGSVLLVKRKFFPNKGALALPGGFVNIDERLYDAAVRECAEETGLELQPGWFFGTKYFDDPDRSLRGRILTHAFGFWIPWDMEPVIKAGDDAAEVGWKGLRDVQYLLVHDDHAEIINRMETLYREKPNN